MNKDTKQPIFDSTTVNSTLDFQGFVAAITSPATLPEQSWRPVFVRLTPNDFEGFTVFCRESNIAVIDTIDRQLRDLAIAKLPSPQESTHRNDFIKDTVAAGGGQPSYGNWVYLPWEAKIVHLLDREDYFDVITNRNQDKITRDEQQELRTKRIGVLGLSVGGEAAVTVAQEHLCGQIVLADFDQLDLSNLNRLNAGFDELGQPKSKIVGRRIAKINPYLGVRLFEDGVTAANLEEFLDGLDLVIEECDSLQIKRDVRLLARKRGVNIAYAADERGFLSVEPYQYWPDLLPFHGRVEHPQPAREDFPTLVAFMKALSLWMGGWDKLSKRTRGSLERVGETLCGYPQLASEARYAAGQIGHVARRLLLGERLPPFIGNMDVADLVQSETSRCEQSADSVMCRCVRVRLRDRI
jgi:molybdopterin/thiamine biosynthesis adenylyltransferase